MSNLTIEQFCQVEAFKAEINSLIDSDCQYREKTEGNLTIVELVNGEGSVVQELVIVV